MNPNVDYERIARSAKARERAGKTVLYGFLSIWAVMVLFPF